MAYICGSKLDNIGLRLFLERRWKINRDSLIESNNSDPRVWAREAGQTTIQQAISSENFIVNEHDLKLVLLFRE